MGHTGLLSPEKERHFLLGLHRHRYESQDASRQRSPSVVTAMTLVPVGEGESLTLASAVLIDDFCPDFLPLGHETIVSPKKLPAQKLSLLLLVLTRLA